MRKAVVFLIVFCIVALNFGGLKAAAWDPPSPVSSQAVYLVNSDTGAVVYQKNADQKMAPYSIAKLMTAILTMEKYKDSLNTTVTVKSGDFSTLSPDSSLMDLKAGQQVTIEQLLDGLLIYSGNDAATVLARAVAGDIPTFVNQMNQKAKELGCKNTNYVNVHGLPDDKQYTTAQDTYLIAKCAMSFPKIAEICATTSFTYNGQTLPTTDAMIRKSSQYYYEYVKGGKTGSITNVVSCVTYAQNKSGVTYYAVVMGGTGNYRATNTCFADTVALYKWVFGSFSIKTLVDQGSPQGNEVNLELAWNRTKLQPVADKPFEALIPSNTDLKTVKVITEKNSPTSVRAPLKKGQKIGKADVMLGDLNLGSIDLVSSEDIARSQPLYFVYLVGRFFSSIWFVVISIFLVVIFLLYLILLALYNRRKRMMLRRKTRRR